MNRYTMKYIYIIAHLYRNVKCPRWELNPNPIVSPHNCLFKSDYYFMQYT